MHCSTIRKTRDYKLSLVTLIEKLDSDIIGKFYYIITFPNNKVNLPIDFSYQRRTSMLNNRVIEQDMLFGNFLPE